VGRREGWICWAVLGQGRGGGHEDRTGAGIGVVLQNVERGCCRLHHSTSFTTGTRPVGSTGQMWQPPADLASVGANVEWGAVVRTTQLASPPAQGRWDRLVEASAGMARLDNTDLCAWYLIVGAACLPLAGL